MTLPYLRPFLASLEKPSAEVDFPPLEAAIADKEKIFRKATQGHFVRVLEDLPNLARPVSLEFSKPAIQIGKRDEVSDAEHQAIHRACRDLIAWRKGPIELFGINIDAEWRSDLKWERIKAALPDLAGKTILDIGCNNGVYMFKMAEQRPGLVLGLDPVPYCMAQFQFLQHFAQVPNVHMEMLGVEEVRHFRRLFDVVLSMGIIYHHRHPLQQLIDIHDALRPGGTMLLESMGIPGEDSVALFPEDRYAQMKNVWFLPTLSCLINWARKANFEDIQVVSSTPLTPEEQRVTEWSADRSLENFLDPHDPGKTIEGHPAPWRFCLTAKRKVWNG